MLGVGLNVWRPALLSRRSRAATLAATYFDADGGLAVDFTDMSLVIRDAGTPANNFDGDPNDKLAYSSPSTKWIRNSAGVLVSGTTLQTDHGVSSIAHGLLPEGQRTNLALRSREIEAAPWGALALGAGAAPVRSVTGSARPDGTTGARRVQLDCGDASNISNRSGVTQSIALVSGQAYTVAFRAMATSAGEVGKTVSVAFDGVAVFTFQLAADWTRHTFSGTSSSTSGTLIIQARGTITPRTLDFLIDFCQVEQGSAASSDIVTEGSTVTRARDNITIASSLFPLSATHGTLLVEYIRRLSGAINLAAQINDGSGANSVTMWASDTDDARAQLITSSVLQSNVRTDQAAIGAVGKSAMSWAADSVRSATNGVAGTEDTSATVPSGLSTLVFGGRFGGGNELNGHLRRLIYLPRQMSQAEINAWAAV